MSLGNEPNEVLLSLPYDTVFMDTEVRLIWHANHGCLGEPGIVREPD